MARQHLLILCPLIAACFPFVTDSFFTGQQQGQRPLVPLLINVGGPFLLAFLASAFAKPLPSLSFKARFVLLCCFAFGVGYTASMKYVRSDGPSNLAPIEVVFITTLATVGLAIGALTGTLASIETKRSDKE